MFDAALIESGRCASLGNRRGSLPLAIGLHAGFIGTLIAAGAWSAGEPPESELPVAIVFPRGPSSPLADGRPVPEIRRPSPGPRASAAALPDPRIADAPGVAASPEIPIAEGPRDPSGDGFAGDGRPGVPGGTGTNANFTEVPGMTGDPVPVGGDVRAPQLLSRIEPDYPETMRRSRVEGVVIAEAVITDTGDVKSVRILHSVNPILDRAVVEAVRRCRYRAATLGGRPVAVYLTVTVRFGLRS